MQACRVANAGLQAHGVVERAAACCLCEAGLVSSEHSPHLHLVCGILQYCEALHLMHRFCCEGPLFAPGAFTTLARGVKYAAGAAIWGRPLHTSAACGLSTGQRSHVLHQLMESSEDFCKGWAIRNIRRPA